ncbi:MAG: hypothetical protein KBC56_04895 [Flavobacterium sp.]|nr:hypothetical protein [Flavobacterium sp.]
MENAEKIKLSDIPVGVQIAFIKKDMKNMYGARWREFATYQDFEFENAIASLSKTVKTNLIKSLGFSGKEKWCAFLTTFLTSNNN